MAVFQKESKFVLDAEFCYRIVPPKVFWKVSDQSVGPTNSLNASNFDSPPESRGSEMMGRDKRSKW
jgi:hypothetical protein